MDQGHMCAVLKGPKKIEIGTKLPEELGPSDVQISIKRVGICGTDIHIWQSDTFAKRFVDNIILGHECGGVVTKVGSSVTHLQVGNKVAVNPCITCGQCNFCRHDNAPQCEKLSTIGVPPYNGSGGLMRTLVHPASCVFKMSDTATMDEAASIEPLSVAYRACKKAGIKIGSKVLITGAGPIGLSCLLIANVMGASSVAITDLDPERLKVAKEVGATYTFCIGKDEEESVVAGKIIKESIVRPSAVLETTGVESALNLAILTVEKCGVIVNIGLPYTMLKVNMYLVVLREIRLTGTLGYTNEFAEVIEMVTSGKINIKPLISHHFPLTKAQEAFETAHSRKGMKVMIQVNED